MHSRAIKRTAFALVLASSLAACSSAPSSGDVQRAVDFANSDLATYDPQSGDTSEGESTNNVAGSTESSPFVNPDPITPQNSVGDFPGGDFLKSGTNSAILTGSIISSYLRDTAQYSTSGQTTNGSFRPITTLIEPLEVLKVTYTKESFDLDIFDREVRDIGIVALQNVTDQIVCDIYFESFYYGADDKSIGSSFPNEKPYTPYGDMADFIVPSNGNPVTRGKHCIAAGGIGYLKSEIYLRDGFELSDINFVSFLSDSYNVGYTLGRYEPTETRSRFVPVSYSLSTGIDENESLFVTVENQGETTLDFEECSAYPLDENGYPLGHLKSYSYVYQSDETRNIQPGTSMVVEFPIGFMYGQTDTIRVICDADLS